MQSAYKYLFMLVATVAVANIVQAKKSFLLFSKFQIEHIKFNDSKISFCSLEQNLICLEYLNIRFDKKIESISNESVLSPFEIESAGLVEIFSDAFIRFNDSASTVKSKQMESLNHNTTKITLDFSSGMLVVTASMRIQCQEGYLGPSCTYINLCPRLPPNICRNNGLCVPEDGAIKCKCFTGFQGQFCEELVDPCKDHLCSNRSSCRHDEAKKLKYRCDCESGYTGELCHALLNPCTGNLCYNNATCRLDDRERLRYRCECKDGYHGELCHELLNPCAGNLCYNNATCRLDDRERLRYRCECKDGYHGAFCSLDVDNCAQNETLCSEFINATCLSRKGGHLCHCEGGCKRPSDITSPPDQFSLPFKWPFSELITFLFVIIEAAFIVLLLVLIIFVKRGCCRGADRGHKLYLDDNLLSDNGTKLDKGCIEFGSNYGLKPIGMDDMETSQTINPLFDLNEMQSFSNNHLALDTAGMSTFGRRQ